MRLAFALMAAAAAATLSAPADAQRRDREQDAAFQATQEGRIMPLPQILSRVRVPDARFIGADLDARNAVYRLTFMRGDQVIRIFVDARTGRQLN